MIEKTEFAMIHRIMDAAYFLFMIAGVIVYFANTNLKLGFLVFVIGMAATCIVGNIAMNIQKRIRK